MPRRRTGQKTFEFEAWDRTTALDELDGQVDWRALDSALEVIPVAERGEAGWLPRAVQGAAGWRLARSVGRETRRGAGGPRKGGARVGRSASQSRARNELSDISGS
jgi:hypothetical protein